MPSIILISGRDLSLCLYAVHLHGRLSSPEDCPVLALDFLAQHPVHLFVPEDFLVQRQDRLFVPEDFYLHLLHLRYPLLSQTVHAVEIFEEVVLVHSTRRLQNLLDHQILDLFPDYHLAR